MKRIVKPGLASLGAALLAASGVNAQELFSVNLWSIGKPSSSVWTDQGSTDPTDPGRDPDIDTLWLDTGESAGVWAATGWDNVQMSPFSGSTAPTNITGSEASVASVEILAMRNPAPFQWNTVRDDSDATSIPNATLLGSGTRGTFFNDPGDGGETFPARLVDIEVTGLPFATYDLIVYLQGEGGRVGGGTLRVNDEIAADPGDPSGGMTYIIANAEPDGTLTEIVNPGDTGNYVTYTGLTAPTLKMQAWGDNFNHIGIAGFQIREAGDPPIPGDTDGDGDIDDADLGTSFSNFTGPIGAAGGKTAAEGDTDGDGDVDDADLANSFAGFTGPLGPASVPEPASLALLSLGALCLTRRRRA